MRPAAPTSRSELRQSVRRHTFDLTGEWGFIARDVPLAELGLAESAPIVVPGLWEAQGWLELDGAAWYVRHLDVDTAGDHWTLRFGAVMDEAEVYVNGGFVGRHVGGYTPFSFDVSEALRSGSNELAIRVIDPAAGSIAHLRSAHGKQGWKNDVFPSPPSLYLTYGGIWQPVTLSRHAAVTVEDVFVNGNPSNPLARIQLRNRGQALAAVVELELDGRVIRRDVVLDPGSDHELELHPDLSDLARWSPKEPTLHRADVRVLIGEEAQDERSVRFGVRTIEVEGNRLLLNGRPLRIQAALVQGFRGDSLYAEGTREQIEQEVRAAKALGLNTLRLHIKGFDPTYLDVCDELGMLVHCDLPIAEPIQESELDDTGLLAELCSAAAAEQVIRDRNHASIVLWSAMNEIGAEGQALAVRATAGYERFVGLLYGLLIDLDGTRPVIENDYIEPGRDHVYWSPVLTAHWYGRLSREFLAEIYAKSEESVDLERALLVSEFGEWALPRLDVEPSRGEPRPFWSPEQLRADVSELPWSRTVADFVRGTHSYKGIADRLQIELFRRVPGIAGWCLTELTDVPHEYNGLWELDRTPKQAALEQIEAACRPTLPMLLHVTAAGPDARLSGWNGWAGEEMHLSFAVAHDSAETLHCCASVGVDAEDADDGAASIQTSFEITLNPYEPSSPTPLKVTLPSSPGTHRLTATVTSGGGEPISNSYDIHDFERPKERHPVAVIGSGHDADAVSAAGGTIGSEGLLVIGEAALTVDTGTVVAEALRAGRNVLVLAQTAASAPHLPVSASMADLATEWGSLPYFFSTRERRLTAVPAGVVVTTELLCITPTVVYTALGDERWPERLVLGMYKPAPGRLTGFVVGAVPVGRAHLWFCQLPLVDAAVADDATAVTTLSDLLRAAAQEGVTQ